MTSAVDVELLIRTAETHQRARAHGLIELFRIALVYIPMLEAVFSHDDFIIRQHTVNKVVADETVQRVSAVSEIIVIQTCITRIDGIIDLLGMCYQVIDIVDAMGSIDRVRLNKGRKLEVTLLNPLDRISTLSFTLKLEIPSVGRIL